MLASAGALSAALEMQSRGSAAEGEGRKVLVNELLHVLPSVPAGASSKAAHLARCATQAASVLARLGRRAWPPEYAAHGLPPANFARTLCRSLAVACRAVSGLPRAEAEAVSSSVARLLDSGAGGKAKGIAAAAPPTGAPGAPAQGSLWRAAAAAPGPPLPLLPSDAAALLSGLVPLHCPSKCPGSCLRPHASTARQQTASVAGNA